MNEQAAALVPEGFSIPERFYLQQYEDELLSVEDLSADLLDRIDAGALVVNYSGHGALALWGAEKILDNRGGGHREDVMRLSNTGRYPFVISMSCLNGYFAYPEAWTELYGTNYHSLGEGLLRAPGAGAAAALMPTGMSTADGQQVLDTALFEALFTEDVRTLGDAIQLARQQLLANGGTAFAETSDTFVLLGDPAMELVHPLPRRVKGLEVTRTANGSVRLDWQPATDCFGKPVEGYWIYRRRGPADAWQRLNTGLVTVTGLVDAAPTAAVSGHPYTAGGAQQAEYAVTAVDADGDESVMSAALSAPRIGSSGNGSSGGGGCFISASRNPGKAQPLLRCIPAGIRRSFFWLALLPAAFIFETVLEPWRLSNEDKNRRQI
jgi:hypothetical protein